MIDRLARLSVLVEDYDEAIEFYRDALGFEVLFDGALDDGTRLVHVGPNAESAGLWLFEAESEAQRARVGNQTGSFPTAVFYTFDCRAAYEELLTNDVLVHGEPTESPGDVSVHFDDPYGNTFVLAELTA